MGDAQEGHQPLWADGFQWLDVLNSLQVEEWRKTFIPIWRHAFGSFCCIITQSFCHVLYLEQQGRHWSHTRQQEENPSKGFPTVFTCWISCMFQTSGALNVIWFLCLWMHEHIFEGSRGAWKTTWSALQGYYLLWERISLWPGVP